MLKKDFNLFSAYKSGSAKAGKDPQMIVLVISIFVLIIAGAYAMLYFFKYNKENQLRKIHSDLAELTASSQTDNLAGKTRHNALMILYNNALKEAKDSFDRSTFIDSKLLKTISDAMPSDFIISDMTLSGQSFVLSGTCKEILSPAAFKQALDATGIFAAVRYNGVSKDGADAAQGAESRFAFSFNCEFKGADSE